MMGSNLKTDTCVCVHVLVHVCDTQWPARLVMKIPYPAAPPLNGSAGSGRLIR